MSGGVLWGGGGGDLVFRCTTKTVRDLTEEGFLLYKSTGCIETVKMLGEVGVGCTCKDSDRVLEIALLRALLRETVIMLLETCALLRRLLFEIVALLQRQIM